MSDNEKIVALFRCLGVKFYELQTGFAAMFILCTARRVFTQAEFLEVKAEVAESPDMTNLRGLLDRLAGPTEAVDFERLLREFEGTVQ